MRASARLCAWQCCARLLWFRLCFARILCTQPATVRCTVHGVGVPLGTTRRAHCRKSVRAGAAASLARRGVCRPAVTAGSWLSPASAAPAMSASSARPSRTSRCVRTAEYPLEYPPAHRGSRSAAPHRTRGAVPHGVGFEYQEYPTGVAASAHSTHGAVEYRRLTPWAGAAASFARRGVCRQSMTAAAGSCISPTAAPATSASSARPSRTSRCVRTAEYPLEYLRTAAPVRRLRTADAPRSAARRGLRVPGVPYGRYRLGAQYSQRSGVPPANLWVDAAASLARRGVCRPA